MEYCTLQWTTVDYSILQTVYCIIFSKSSMYNMELDNAGGALWSA